MASVKIVIRKKQSKDGSYPLAIRITSNRKTSFIHLGKNIKETDWDAINQRAKKSHPNSARLNNFIIKKLAEANDQALELSTKDQESSSRAVKKALKPKGGLTFFALAQQYLDGLKAKGKYNIKVSDEPRIKRFKEFLNGEDIAFQDISVALLKRFQIYLKEQYNIKDRTIINYLIVIRTIFNQALDEKIVDPKFYPFGKHGVKIKFPDSLKIGFTPEEVKTLEEIELPPISPIDHARNIWLFSFYFAGMRISDVLRLKWSDFANGRLYYKMGKNDKGGSLKIPEKAERILQLYKDKGYAHNLIFPGIDMLVSCQVKDVC